jgi:predicted permease
MRGRLAFLDAFVQDVHYALRGMRRAPGFAAIAVLTLAVGIGANTAMFSLADALVIKPLPVERPGELRALFQVLRVGGRALKAGTMVPYPLYRDLRERADGWAGILAFAELDELTLAIGPDGEARANGAVFVSDNYFSLLGVTPRLGRALAPGEDLKENTNRVVLLSDRFWKRAFEGRRDVLGRTIRIAGNAFTIVGVAPPEFFGLVLGRSPDVYLPLGSLGLAQPGIVPAQDPSSWLVHVVGRLAAPLTDRAAADRLTSVMQASFSADPKPVIELLPIDTGFSDVRTRFLRPVQVLMVLVGILLFIACANVAVMLSARNVTRRKEIAIRLAIGAGGRRVLRQLMTEGLLLALLGAGVGLALAPWTTQALVALLPHRTGPMALHVGIDARVLVFTASVAVLAALVFAAIPAVRAIRLETSGSLAGRERGVMPVGAPLGGSLVAAQVAMSLVILTGAGLLVRTLYELATLNPGYDTDRVILLDVTPASRGYVDGRRTAYYRDLLERLGGIPGVHSATASQIGLLDRENRTTGVLDRRGSAGLSEEERRVQVYLVGPRFFETLGIPIVSGRDFTAADMAGPRVAALNETAARRFFQGDRPVGSVVNNDVQVVAVVGDSKYHELREPPEPAMFVPYTQSRIRERMTFSVRATRDVAPALLRAAAALDPLVPMRVNTLSEIKDRSLVQERLLAALSAFFAVTALSLLTIGLVGLVTFRVRQRTAEIGVRVALGARRGQVIWLVLSQPVVLAAAGIVVGLPATLAITRLMTVLLFGLSPNDGPTLAGATIAVLLTVVGAAAWPAWRASRLDPMTALRDE